MTDKLRDAMDNLQAMIDSGEVIDHTSHEELEEILEAAWRYWDQTYAEGDPWDE